MPAWRQRSIAGGDACATTVLAILSGRTGSLRTRSSHTTVRTVPYTAVRSESYGDSCGCALVSLKEAVKSELVEMAV